MATASSAATMRSSMPLPSRSSCSSSDWWVPSSSPVYRASRSLDRVARLGGVEQVGGDARVELEASQVEADLVERAHRAPWRGGLARRAARPRAAAPAAARRRRRRAMPPAPTSPCFSPVAKARPSRSLRPATPTHKRPDGDGLVPAPPARRASRRRPSTSSSATSAVSRPSVGWLSTMGASSTSASRSNSDRNSRNSKDASPRRDRGCTPSAAMLPRSTSIGGVAPQDHDLCVLAHPGLVRREALAGASASACRGRRRCRRVPRR